MNARYPLYLLIISSAFLTSCFNPSKITNFNGITDTTIRYSVENLEPVIQKNDILSISVSSMNTEATEPFNLYTLSSTQGAVNSGTVSQASGFLVDQEGYIQFPMLGKIKAAGIRKKELKDAITKGLINKKILYEPIVNIRYLNYKVSVFGEVAHPNVINVPSEKITIVEALSLAGDLTPYASRKNVLLIRDNEEGIRVTKRLNLTDKNLLSSPYYYLKSNDIVYVSPERSRVANTNTTKQWLPVIISALTFVVVLIDQINE